MVLIGTSPARTRRRPRCASEVVRIANARAGEGFVASARRRARSSGATGRTAAIARHTMRSSSRGLVIRSSASANTPTRIERHSTSILARNKLKLLDELEAYLAWRTARRKTGDADTGRPAREEVLADRAEQASRRSRSAAAAGHGWARTWTRRSPARWQTCIAWGSQRSRTRRPRASRPSPR